MLDNRAGLSEVSVCCAVGCLHLAVGSFLFAVACFHFAVAFLQSPVTSFQLSGEKNLSAVEFLQSKVASFLLTGRSVQCEVVRYRNAVAFFQSKVVGNLSTVGRFLSVR